MTHTQNPIPTELSISAIDSAQIQSLVSDWESRGAHGSDIATIKDWDCASCITCQTVSQGGVVLAAFDIRDAIAHVKNMDVVFSPALAMNLDGEEIEVLTKKLDFLLYILSEIFKFVVKLSDKWGTVKIFNDSNGIGTVFVAFANELKKSDPKYSVKLYRRWVEITNKDGGGV